MQAVLTLELVQGPKSQYRNAVASGVLEDATYLFTGLFAVPDATALRY